METKTATRRRTASKASPVTRERKLQIQFWESMILIIVGCCLLVAAFIVPPTGVIHSSVLVAFGEILTFAGTALGMNYKYRANKKD